MVGQKLGLPFWGLPPSEPVYFEWMLLTSRDEEAPEVSEHFQESARIISFLPMLGTFSNWPAKSNRISTLARFPEIHQTQISVARRAWRAAAPTASGYWGMSVTARRSVDRFCVRLGFHLHTDGKSSVQVQSSKDVHRSCHREGPDFQHLKETTNPKR